MRRNLVIARVGRGSLHRAWLGGVEARNWDLYLAPYQEIDPQDDIDCVVGAVLPGPKWAGIRDVLRDWDGWRSYDHVWFPDDDIRAAQDDISALFDVAASVGLDLFAPALAPASFYAHYSTMQNARFFGRWVGFVEIMMPAFSRGALETLLPTFDLGETGWGWGLDSVWPKLLGYRNVAVIDGIAVTHTRPVGEMRDTELRRRVLAESDTLLERFDCRQVHTTFGAFGADLESLDLAPERLFAMLVEGWQYLFGQDPRILSWIAAFQARHFAWPEYPVDGIPGPPGD